MHLISLELQGFKSFPDKVKLEFGKGITGVVGPNGSGKSNIGDAMRWVMGEQSTKTLRGGKMEDVIFTGTEKRKAVGFAVATLNIDNTDRSLNVDHDIVAVTRKLYRSGESEYIINGEQVRLKDVVELFMDTGLGKDGYSIIGQGRIAEIVSGKPAERREIFEEAAGVSKFRYRKLQAERKLVAAEDNILRLTDIIGELESRIEPLRAQSEKAKKFKLLDDEKQQLEISVWVHRLNEMKDAVTRLEQHLADVTSQYDDSSREVEELETSIEDNLMNAAQCAGDIEKLRENIHEIEMERSRSLSLTAVLENDISHISESIESIKNRIEQSFMSADRLSEQKEEKLKEAQSAQNDIDDLDKDIAACEKDFDDISLRDSDAQRSEAEQTAEINTMYVRSSELSFMLENCKNSAADISEQTEALLTEKEHIEKELEQQSQEKKQLDKKLLECTAQYDEAKNKLEGYTMLLNGKKSELEKTQSEYNRCDSEAREKSQRLKILSDLENSMEGFSRSVKQVIKASKQGRISGILGSLAQLVTTEPKYSLAIETAMGAAIQNIVVENEDTAKRCIRFLKEENAGRATFLPITSVRGRRYNGEDLSSYEGYVAMACQLVSYDKRLEEIVLSVLGTTVIAEDMDTAAVMAKKTGYKTRIVTLDGQVINAGGSFTGGSAFASAGILTRRNEIDKLKAQISELNEKSSSLEASLRRLRQENDKLEADCKAQSAVIGEKSTEIVRIETEVKRVADIRTQLDTTAESLKGRLLKLSEKMTANENEYDSAKAELSQLSEKIKEKEEQLAKAQQSRSDSRGEREALAEKLSQLRLRRVSLEKDKQMFEDTARQIEQSIQDLSSDRSGLEEQIKQQLAEIDKKKSEIEGIKASMSDHDGSIKKINEEIAAKQSEHSRFDALAAQQRSMLKIKNDSREKLSQDVARASEKQTALQDEYDKIIASLWEQYELSRSEAIERSEPIEDISAANKRLSELRGKIKHLGSVNLGAIEEYREVSERYGFLSEQLKDVTDSKRELEKLIAELTENMKALFTESFEKINLNFKRIFAELFGGGKAELTLDDPSDILESGIEIRVAPPGKVIKNLSLLSGGEQSFVAIAIYFSILAVKPSPFCLLDEIEAALDDVNVVKYAQYLRRFTDKTQFIAITHRRGTMEEADVLYGVTMQEKGVSRLLKMNVDQAQQNAEK